MEIGVIKKIINNTIAEHSQKINTISIAERYYRKKNDILYIDKDGEDTAGNPLRNADNRIPSNFHSLLVNQKSAYMFTAPPTFDIGDKANNDRITDTLGDGFPKICKDLCINASNASVSWLHIWEEDNELQYGIVDSKQIIPMWTTSLNKKLVAVLRVYSQISEEGKKLTIYEYWTDKECYSYEVEEGKSIEEGLNEHAMFLTYNFDSEDTSASNHYTHSFKEVPFIPFYNNNIHTGDLDDTKPLVDVYDKVYSGFMNDLEDIQEVIFVLTNYPGTELSTFLSELKKYKTIKMESNGMDDKSGLETLNIDIPIEAREKMLIMTRKAIFEQGQGVDPDPQSFGNASGVALKYLYSLLELKAGLMETEFRLGLGRLIRLICNYKNIPVKKIIQTWTRTSITNDTELADIAKSSIGIISNTTVRKNHPWVDDEESESMLVEKERKSQEEEYPNFLKGKGEVDEE